MILLVCSSLIFYTVPLNSLSFSMLSFHVPLHGGEKVTFSSCRRCKTTEYTAFTNFGILRVFGIQKFKSPVTIPHICHFWDATIFLGLQKVRKKIASRQNSVNFILFIILSVLVFSFAYLVLGILIGIFGFWL